MIPYKIYTVDSSRFIAVRVSYHCGKIFQNSDTTGHETSICFRSCFVFEHKQQISLLASLTLNNLLFVKTISCKVLYWNIVNFASIVIEKAKWKYLLIWSGVNPLAIRRCFVVGSSNTCFAKLLCMALVVCTFKFSHGCVRCSCRATFRFIAFLYSCGIAFITP